LIISYDYFQVNKIFDFCQSSIKTFTIANQNPGRHHLWMNFTCYSNLHLLIHLLTTKDFSYYFE